MILAVVGTLHERRGLISVAAALENGFLIANAGINALFTLFIGLYRTDFGRPKAHNESLIISWTYLLDKKRSPDTLRFASCKTGL